MAIICRNYNLLFVMTPRTACTAVGKVLLDELGGEYLPLHDLMSYQGRFIVQKKHCTLNDLMTHGILNKSDLDDLYVFTTIRNHFDSIYSLYVKQRVKYFPLLEDKNSWIHKEPGYAEAINEAQKLSFEEWVTKYYGFPKYLKLLDKGHRALFNDYTVNADYVMMFENLQTDFNNVLKNAGLDRQIEIPRINTTGGKTHNSYKEAYNNHTEELIGYVFTKELKRYGYSF